MMLKMTRAGGLVALFVLALVGPASAHPHAVEPPPSVRIGHAALGASADGHAVVRVPVTYPIQKSSTRSPSAKARPAAARPG